jgi:hypothetical protein
MGNRQYRFKYMPRLITAIGILTAAVAVSVTAANFVSLNGKFYITYPDNWHQVDFTTVDYYLSQSQPTGQTYQYEGVFAEKTGRPFYAGNYVLVTIDTVGNLTAKQRDSVISQLAASMGSTSATQPFDEFLKSGKTDIPCYDPATGMLGVLNDIRQGGQAARKGLLVLKFYNRGVVDFYFYSPDSLYEAAKPIFRQILASFSTDNLQAAAPKEPVKIADAEKLKSEPPAAERSKSSYVIFLAVLVVLFVVVVVVRKGRSKNTVRP